MLSLLTHRSEDEAVAIANETDYGLAAFISSTDVQKAQSLARRIDAGVVPHQQHHRWCEREHDSSDWRYEAVRNRQVLWRLGLEEYLEPKTVI